MTFRSQQAVSFHQRILKLFFLVKCKVSFIWFSVIRVILKDRCAEAGAPERSINQNTVCFLFVGAGTYTRASERQREHRGHRSRAAAPASVACLIQTGHDQFWEPVLKDRGTSLGWLTVPLKFTREVTGTL